MSRCECKTGFFALRDCTERVAGRCRSCQRSMCRRHSDPESQFSECLDCSARRSEMDPEDLVGEQQDASSRRFTSRDADTADTALDDRWVHGYRHRFYSSGYLPIYAGTHHSSYYDRYDSRSFEYLEVEKDEFGADDGVGFGDS